MHRNRLWLSFLVCVAIVVAGYSCMVLYRLYNYWRLDARTAVTSISWDVQEVEEDRFATVANYSFYVGDRLVDGKESLKPFFDNKWAAEAALPRTAEEHKVIWYQLSHPVRSSLQKQFPLKESVYMIILIALFGYFVWLGFYVRRFNHA